MKRPRRPSRKSTDVVAQLYTVDYVSGAPYGVGFGLSAQADRVDWVAIMIPGECAPGIQEAIRVARSHELLPLGSVAPSQVLLRISCAMDLERAAYQVGFQWGPADRTQEGRNT